MVGRYILSVHPEAGIWVLSRVARGSGPEPRGLVSEPLDREQLEHVCAILNAEPVDRAAAATQWDEWRTAVLTLLRACVRELRGLGEFQVESREAARLHHLVGSAIEILAQFSVRDQAGGGDDGE